MRRHRMSQMWAAQWRIGDSSALGDLPGRLPSLRQTTSFLVCGLALACLYSGAIGQTADTELIALGESTEPLLALPLGEAPGASYVITAEEIERSGAANIFDLLRRVPGVDIRYTPMGGHIGIRSTGTSPFSEEVLLLIDGSPYNSPDKGGFPGHPNYAGFFPMDRIARIEIIKGPISVLYGANAFGGVINIISKKAADAVTDEVEGYAVGATLVGGTRDTFERALRGALIVKGLEATLEVGAADGDTPIRLNGDATHSRNSAYLALRHENLWGSILHQESTHGPFDFDGKQTRTARNNVDIVDVHYDAKITTWAVRSSATLNRYRGTTCAVCHNNQTKAPDGAKTDEVGDEHEIDQRVRVASRADGTLTDTQDLTLGIEAARDSVDRRIVRLDEVDDEVDSGGAYVQHQWHFGNRKAHLLTGLRFDTMEKLGNVLSPRLSVVCEPLQDLVVRASWSRAYRAPTWNERFRNQRFLPENLGPGLILTLRGNPELERERIDSAEAGISWRALPELLVKADLFYDEFDGFIGLAPSAFVPGTPNEIRQVYENREEPFRVWGGELSLSSRPTKTLSLTAGYAYKEVDLDESDPAAAYAPRSRGTLTVSWTPGSWSFDLAGSSSSSYTVSAPSVFGVRPQPSYELFDAAIKYRFPVRAGRLSVGVIGRNLLDRHPFETLVGPDEDTSLRGRVVAIELKADF